MINYLYTKKNDYNSNISRDYDNQVKFKFGESECWLFTASISQDRLKAKLIGLTLFDFTIYVPISNLRSNVDNLQSIENYRVVEEVLFLFIKNNPQYLSIFFGEAFTAGLKTGTLRLQSSFKQLLDIQPNEG